MIELLDAGAKVDFHENVRFDLFRCALARVLNFDPSKIHTTLHSQIFFPRLSSQIAPVSSALRRQSNTTSQGRHTALLFAASRGHADCVRLLLERRADIRARDRVRIARLIFLEIVL
jgi:ankyrin repeat protein